MLSKAIINLGNLGNRDFLDHVAQIDLSRHHVSMQAVSSRSLLVERTEQPAGRDFKSAGLNAPGGNRGIAMPVLLRARYIHLQSSGADLKVLVSHYVPHIQFSRREPHP